MLNKHLLNGCLVTKTLQPSAPEALVWPSAWVGWIVMMIVLIGFVFTRSFLRFKWDMQPLCQKIPPYLEICFSNKRHGSWTVSHWWFHVEPGALGTVLEKLPQSDFSPWGTSAKASWSLFMEYWMPLASRVKTASWQPSWCELISSVLVPGWLFFSSYEMCRWEIMRLSSECAFLSQGWELTLSHTHCPVYCLWLLELEKLVYISVFKIFLRFCGMGASCF